MSDVDLVGTFHNLFGFPPPNPNPPVEPIEPPDAEPIRA